MMRMLADVEVVRVLGPKVFWPRPKVDSAIIKIAPNAEKRAAIPDLPWFLSFVREVFTLRRKNLRGVLYARWKDRWPGGKAEVDAFLDEQGLAGDLRAEAMDGPELLIELDLGLGDGIGEAFGCDLTQEYVIENSEYTT